RFRQDMKCGVRECSASASIASRSGRRPPAYGRHPLLVLGRLTTERNRETLEHGAIVQQIKCPFTLAHDDAVGKLRCLRLWRWRRKKADRRGEHKAMIWDLSGTRRRAVGVCRRCSFGAAALVISVLAGLPAMAAEYAIAPGQKAIGELRSYVIQQGDVFPDIA